jgi:hypothetical protein
MNKRNKKKKKETVAESAKNPSMMYTFREGYQEEYFETRRV